MSKLIKYILFFFAVAAGALSSLDARAENFTITQFKSADVFQISSGQEIRLIGIAPVEGREKDAIEVLEWMKFKNAPVRIEFDQKRKNDQGQLLGYVYIYLCPLGCAIEAVHNQHYERLDDGWYIMLNATMLKSGLARLDLDRKNRTYNKEFRRLYWEAKVNKRGVWKEAK